MSSKMTRWERRQLSEKHPWRVGDLCTATYNDVGEGLIYRVLEVNGTQLKVKPVFGVIADTANRKTRSLGKGWCVPLSLIDLATEYTRFGLFIANEARIRGMDDEPETAAATIPAGDGGVDQRRDEDDDGGGLCADAAARGELG